MDAAFCGVDEVAEIDYLLLKESGLILDVVMDDHVPRGNDLLRTPIVDLVVGINTSDYPVALTFSKRTDALVESSLA